RTSSKQNVITRVWKARILFRQNQQVCTDLRSPDECTEECEARREIGLHYSIPYPRPTAFVLQGHI
uniref:Uncharacterized protein n=1 Tax=Cyprinus carpio TaxID=7962 RepID=A0A8C1W5H8_CYPCA